MLTLTEQLKVVNKQIAPDEASLITLVHSSGINAARDFNPNHKTFDTVDNSDPVNPIAINTEANAYLTKMLNATRLMITTDSKGSQSLMLVMASIISNLVPDEATIIGADQSQWEAFINDHIVEALELFAGVKVQEKAAYNLLP